VTTNVKLQWLLMMPCAIQGNIENNATAHHHHHHHHQTSHQAAGLPFLF